MSDDPRYRVVFIPIEEWKEWLRAYAPQDEPGTDADELFNAGTRASGDFVSAVYDAQRTILEGDSAGDEDSVRCEPFAVVPMEVDGKAYHCVYLK